MLSRLGRFHRARAGEVLLTSGAPLEGTYLLFKGRVVVTASRRAALGARFELCAGHVFGQANPGRPERSTMRVRATEDATLLHLDSLALSQLLAENLELGTRLLFEQRALKARIDEASEAEARKGSLVGVYGPASGAGTTTSAIVLAQAAADLDQEVLLVDLHPWFGDVAALCGCRPTGDLTEYLSGERDEARLRELGRADLDFDLLAAPLHPEDGEAVTPAAIVELLDLAVGNYDVVVVDLPEGVSELVLAVLERADQVLLTVTADFQGLLGLRRARSLLEHLDVPPEILNPVLNRFRGAGGLAPDALQELVGQPAPVLAEDAGQLLRLANDGRLHEAASELPDHPLVRCTRDFLHRLLGLTKPLGGTPSSLQDQAPELLTAAEGTPTVEDPSQRTRLRLLGGMALVLLAQLFEFLL